MRVAIIGAGFTGLTAAYELTKKGHQVTVFEKENLAGGLASGIRHVVDDYPKDWEWDLERFYHHWFTNDKAILNLIEELGVKNKLIVKRPITATWHNGQAYQLDSPLSLLSFSPLSFISRLRTGATLAYLKYAIQPNRTNGLENVTADKWLRRHMGQEAYKILWKPLLQSKFDQHYEDINMTWFWARIFKRTPRLAYFEGGFSALVDLLVEKIEEQGGKIQLETKVRSIYRHSGAEALTGAIESQSPQYEILSSLRSSRMTQKKLFDHLIIATPPPTLLELFPSLKDDHPNYTTKLTSQKGIGAYVLILVLDKPFLPNNIYWLNINQKNWPFLAVVEHTNFVDPQHYGGQHILYIGDYLPADHPRMQMSKEEILEELLPYLQQLNPNLKSKILNLKSWLFREPYAQPIVGLNHAEKILPLETPIEGVYLASMAQVYPWDRGTNYAVELGQQVAEQILNSKHEIRNSVQNSNVGMF